MGAVPPMSDRLAAIHSHLRGVQPPHQPSVAQTVAETPALRSHGPADDPPGADRPGLTAAEIEFFKVNGFLVKRRLIPPEVLLPFVDEFWATLRGPFDRSDPATFKDAGQRWDNARTQGSGYGEGARTPGGLPTTRELDDYRPNNVRKMGGLGKEARFVAATSAYPAVLATVHSLLGGQLKVPNSNRGMYGIFPSSQPVSTRLGPHHDNNPFDLGGVIYMSDVSQPRSGGYTVCERHNPPRARLLLAPHECGLIDVSVCSRAGLPPAALPGALRRGELPPE